MKKIFLIFSFLCVFGLHAQTVSYLIVGAGGSNNSFQSGGGGGGGVISNTLTATTGTFPVTIGLSVPGNSGQNTTAFGFTAIGGGYGGFNDGENFTQAAIPSGGGSAVDSGTGAVGTSGQSFAGGNGSASAGGGGGGAGAIGSNASGSTGGNGGAGITSTISGSSYVYGSGGGAYGSVTGGTGGAGAGSGAAALGDPTSATNYGGGGGGSGINFTDGLGFQGVVILRYTTGQVTATGGTITTDGGSTIHTFTSSSNFIVTAVSGGSPNVSGIRIFFQQ